MGIEKKENNPGPIDKKLRQKALQEMRDSGKPMPFEGTPEKNLSAVIDAARKALGRDLRGKGSSLSTKENLRIGRDTFSLILTAMGISDETTSLIIETIERDTSSHSGSIH